MRRLARDGGSGQALVEFALLLPVLVILVVGIINVALAVWQENTLAYAAREGTRYAIVHGSAAPTGVQGPSSGNTADIVSAVKSAAVGVANVSVSVTYPEACNDRGCPVAVDATAPFHPVGISSVLRGALSITLRGGSLLVIQQ